MFMNEKALPAHFLCRSKLICVVLGIPDFIRKLHIFVIGLLTNEFCDGVVFSFCADCSCNAVVLQDGQEELNEI